MYNGPPADARVRDVMTAPIGAIGPETGLKECAARLLEAGSGLLPVVDAAGILIGVLSEADLLVKAERPPPAAEAGSYTRRLERQRWSGTAACHLMSRPPVTVTPETGVADAAQLMRRYALARLPVVDGGGRPVGVVDRGQLLQALAPERRPPA